MKSAYIKFIGAVVSLMLIAGNVSGQPSGGGNSLAAQVAALQVAVSNLQATVTAQQGTITALKSSNDELHSRLQYVSLVGQDMYITGANLHIVSGSGATDGVPYGTVNGLGNLIVGYNESSAPMGGHDDRSGSHNIVVGTQHNFSSYGGLVAGRQNTISGPYASVSGGYLNTASGNWSSVSGGSLNTASGDSCWVSGGQLNTASQGSSSVSGGARNTASGDRSSVSGGVGNTASGVFSSVSGGFSNTASWYFSSVSGGFSNTASGVFSSVSGGAFNTASGTALIGAASVSGGQNLVEADDFGWAGGNYHTP